MAKCSWAEAFPVGPTQPADAAGVGVVGNVADAQLPSAKRSWAEAFPVGPRVSVKRSCRSWAPYPVDSERSSAEGAQGACESEPEPEQVLEVLVPRVVVLEPPSETRHVPIGNPDMPPSPPSRETSPRDMSETTTPCESPESLHLGTVLQKKH